MCLECHENDNIIHEKTEMQIVYWMFADVQQNIFNWIKPKAWSSYSVYVVEEGLILCYGR